MANLTSPVEVVEFEDYDNANASYMGNMSAYPDFCPQFSPADIHLLESLAFWVEGVIQTSIAVTGVVFNTISSLILGTKDMRNSFNLLLIALSFFDSCYLLGSILESLRKSFDIMTTAHVVLFPYFLYPGQMVMMTASILMTVAIAMERYVAVHYPLDYNQSMNDENASIRRLLKYFIPVLTFSILFNVPKFFEAKIEWGEKVYTNATGNWTVMVKPQIAPTELRLNGDYHRYYNTWLRLVILGIVPFVLLVFFNTKIYQDIQVRRRRRCPRPPSSNSSERAGADQAGTSRPSSLRRQQQGSANGRQQQQQNAGETVGPSPSPRDPAPKTELKPTSALKRARQGNSTKVVRGTMNANRRRLEDNLAVIFMGIVIFFLVSQFPRIFLCIHEMVVMDLSTRCNALNLPPFEVWVLAFNYISHLFLVLNCSVNSLIYCGLSSRFRKQALTYTTRLAQAMGLSKDAHVAFGRMNAGGAIVTAERNNIVLRDSISVNGVRPSNGMTTWGAQDESPLLDLKNGLTQTTQV